MSEHHCSPPMPTLPWHREPHSCPSHTMRARLLGWPNASKAGKSREWRQTENIGAFKSRKCGHCFYPGCFLCAHWAVNTSFRKFKLELCKVWITTLILTADETENKRAILQEVLVCLWMAEVRRDLFILGLSPKPFAGKGSLGWGRGSAFLWRGWSTVIGKELLLFSPRLLRTEKMRKCCSHWC